LIARPRNREDCWYVVKGREGGKEGRREEGKKGRRKGEKEEEGELVELVT
jgi:hypothetical protein